MIRVAAFAVALAAALVAGAEAPAKVEGRLFALLGTQTGQFVIEVDPGTLEPVAGGRLQLAPAGPGAPWTLDPSRHTLAIARGNRLQHRLQLIDLPSLRPAWSMTLDRRSYWSMEPSGVVWLRPDRIVILRRGVERYEVLVVDVAGRRVVLRRQLAGGSVVDSERTQSEVVILRAPTSAIGPASLLVVASGGEAREIPLPRILAGARFDHDVNPPSGKHNLPALALDNDHRTAYVVAPDGLVARVSIDSGSVDYHAVRGRFAKLFSGSSRQALILDGKIVVTGSNSDVWTGKDGKPAMRTDPAGLDVIDPATWQARRLANSVSSVVRSPGGFLATGGSWSSERGHESGIGLAAYGIDGVERFRLLDGKRIWVNTVYGGKAYVLAANEEPLRVIDLEAGRVIGTRQAYLPWLLLEQNAPVW